MVRGVGGRDPLGGGVEGGGVWRSAEEWIGERRCGVLLERREGFTRGER